MPFRVTRNGTTHLTYAQVRGLDILKPTRGVRAESDDWWDHVRAFALVLPPLTAFSHTSAARIQGLPLPADHERPLHVTTDVSGKRGRRQGLVWHQRPLTGVEQWQGLPVTPPLRTWQDLAGVLASDDLVVVADVLLRRRLCSLDELAGTRGVRHGAALRKAAERADAGSASPEETRLRLALLDRGLPPPVLNHHVVEDGEWLGCGDLVWPGFTVIADYDGAHHDEKRQRHQDAQTRDDYVAAGWRHLVITSGMSRTQAVTRIERALRTRGWVP